MEYKKAVWYYDHGLLETLYMLSPKHKWANRIQNVRDYAKIQPMTGPVGAIHMLRIKKHESNDKRTK